MAELTNPHSVIAPPLMRLLRKATSFTWNSHALFVVLPVLIAVLEATQGYVGWRSGAGVGVLGAALRGGELGWADFFYDRLVSWSIIGLWGYGVFALAGRCQIFDSSRTAVMVHAAASLVAPALLIGTSTSIRYALFLRDIPAASWTRLLARQYTLYSVLAFLMYWGIVGVYSTFRYRRLYAERELRNAHLERDLVRLQSSLLQSKLQPHFLFNTLNAISGSAKRARGDEVVLMLARLAEMLRYLLQGGSSSMVRLEDELGFVGTYLELQKIRFQQLSTDMCVAPDTLSVMVPPLLVQPLVENAIEHGLRTKQDGRLAVRTWREGDMVWIQVIDNGCGFGASGSAAAQGVGLSATRERLRNIYADQHLFITENVASGGASVRIRIPTYVTG